MKKLIFFLLFTVSIYGQTLQNPTFGIVTEKTNATDSAPAYFTTTQVDGVHKKTPAANVEKTANKSDSYTTSSSTTYASTKAVVDGLATKSNDTEVIHKNATPETKIGGLTLGTNLASPSDSWLTFGTSVTNSAVYSTPASIQLNLTLVNYGVSGSTSNNLASQYVNIPTWTTAYRLLSVEHSINDSAQAVSLATFRSNLEAFIANAKSKGWPDNRILIINGNYCTAAPMITTLESYADEAMAIAKEQGVQYFDAYNYTLNNGAGSLLSDGVHPTTAGGLVYARGLIASMQGGMEITNGLTVDNGLQVNGIINATKQINTLGSVKTGNGENNNPANTVIGDVIVPFTAGIITQHSQTGIISKFTPIELVSGFFSSTFRNYIENGNILFYTAGATRGNQNLALRINSTGIIDTPFGVNSLDNIGILFGKEIKNTGTGWTNKLIVSEASGHTFFSNGYSAGNFNFNVSNGVTNAANLAFQILNNKSARVYGDFTVDENIAIGFNKNIQYVGAYTNKVVVSESTGALGLFAGRNVNGDINFYISKGVTNAANLAMKVAMNGEVLINTTSNNGVDKLQVNGSISATNYTGSATLTGTPTAPTATAGTNTTQIATTAFVKENTDATAHWTKTGDDITNNNTGKIYFGAPATGTVGGVPNIVSSNQNIVTSGQFASTVGYGFADQSSGLFESGGKLLLKMFNPKGVGIQNVYQNHTSGTQNDLSFVGSNINPTSGNAVFNNIAIESIINQTGGANGITRGIYINPTLTSAFDFRAIEVTTGKVIVPVTTETAIQEYADNAAAVTAGLTIGTHYRTGDLLKIVH